MNAAAQAKYVCELADEGVLGPDERVFITTSPVIDEAAGTEILPLESELAHALVLGLATMPEATRRPFADRFFAARTGRHAFWAPEAPYARLAIAAFVALLVIDLAAPHVQGVRVLDLLNAAAQGDDLSLTPEPALAELRKVVARTRLDLGLEDPLDPRSAATTAVVEVIDPSSGEVALQEILTRATWAAVRSWEPERVLDFLLAADRAFARAAA